MGANDSSERYRLVEAIYQQAVDTPPDSRAGFLAGRCAGDIALQREVETLLKHYEAAGARFLNLTTEEPWQPPAPQRIGRYAIIRLIGQGGMGAVFEARQENPVRNVAVKLMRSALPSAEALRRFEYEATVLGRLQHSGIAHIYEAGLADLIRADGVSERKPFFAMELIHGVPLHQYVRTTASMSERLELFARICDAVAHAHQKSVIHRDLKPANILVTPEGGPKILDFGVARVTQPDLPVTTMHTHGDQIVGTLPYMSPEQIAGHADKLDSRSDVYSLGVVLYELLADRLPYDIAGKPIASAARIITEQPPLPLSRVNRALRGELDTIVQKALEKDPARRYAGASDLAADLRRYTRHEPITARPASAAYQLRKLAQRNKAVVAGIAATVLVLVAGVIVSVIFAIGEARQREESERQREIARAVNDFFNHELLERANPFSEPDRDIRLRDVLDRAARRIDGRFPNQPLVEAEIRDTAGRAYLALGELESAETQLARALELVTQKLGDNHPQTIRRRLELGEVYRKAFRFEDAERMWRPAAELAMRVLGPRHPDTLEARNNLGVLALRQNQVAAAETVFRDVLAIRRETLGADHGATLVSMNGLGSALERLGRNDEAESLYVECVDRSRRGLGPEHPDTLIAINNLGLFYTRVERFAQAEPLCLEVLESRRRVLGEQHVDTLSAMNNVGYFYSLQSRFAECEPYYVKTYELRRAKLGADHPDTLLSMNNLGWLYGQMKRWDEAEQILIDLVEITRRVQPDSLDLALSAHTLAGVLLKRDRLNDAEPLLREAVAGCRSHLPEGDGRIGICLTAHGNCLRLLARFEEAEPILLDGQRRLREVLGPAHRQTKLSTQALVNLYTDWNRPDELARWQAENVE